MTCCTAGHSRRKGFMLTLVTALSVAAGIGYEGPDTKTNGPNDIVVNGKKVLRVLTEMSTEWTESVIRDGDGINANTHRFPPEIRTRHHRFIRNPEESTEPGSSGQSCDRRVLGNLRIR